MGDAARRRRARKQSDVPRAKARGAARQFPGSEWSLVRSVRALFHAYQAIGTLFLFCKAATTLCVHSRKNRRGAAKQNQTHEQNGAGRLLTAPEPSAPSGRCSEAEAGPETERCAEGESPWCSATISGLGMVVGSFCTYSLSCVSSNRYALSFCKAATTLCVNSCKNRRGAAKQNQTHEQNGAGRLFPLPEPSNEK